MMVHNLRSRTCKQKDVIQPIDNPKREILNDRTNKNVTMSTATRVKDSKSIKQKIHGSDKYNVKNENLQLEKMALYDFEIDENDPLPKKPKRKRKIVRKKKIDVSDTTDDDVSVLKEKHLRPRLKKCMEKVSEKSKSKESEEVMKGNSIYLENRQQKMKPKNVIIDKNVQENNFHSNSLNPEILNKECKSQRITETKKQRYSKENKENICQKSTKVCDNLTEHTELNFSAIDSDPNSPKRNINVLNCGAQHVTLPLTYVTNRKKVIKSKKVDPNIFTIENCFGFDEDSEDDLCLSISPVKSFGELKSALSVPFAVSSTPNWKTTTNTNINVSSASSTKFELLQKKLSSESIFDPTTLMQNSISSAVSTRSPAIAVLQTAAMTSVSLKDSYNTPALSKVQESKPENVTSTSDTPDDEPLLFLDGLQNFKPPRRSYERSRHPETENEENDTEVHTKKHTKRMKKKKAKEDKMVQKWAANLSAEFEEIDSFELCVD